MNTKARPASAFVSLLKIVIGLTLGLVLAEQAFAWRDQSAFPHVNFYAPDAELGVRLTPHAHMKISFGGNPVTELHTNTRGFRGSDWPAPSLDDVLVVGDSQVFGLGVSDRDTFSAQLEARLAAHGAGHGHVLNAGVPTYGPLEYTRLVERLVAERKPDAVIYVLNLANDLFELQRPNTTRHAVWDGWAVRKENAPRDSDVLAFPGRAWLMSQSHLVYAIRRLWHGEQTESDPGLPSEGGYQDLNAQAAHHETLQVTEPAALRSLTSARSKLAQRLAEIDGELQGRFVERVRTDPRYAAAVKPLGFHGNPEDILSNEYAEEARPVNLTAYHLVMAALAMSDNDALLRATATRSRDAPTLALLDERKQLRAQLAEHVTSTSAASGPLDELLARTRRACEAVGTRLVIVALPLDVQVSSTEWKKYGKDPIDMSATRVLASDIVTRARAQGLLALDATAALAKADPGAFLHADLHMTRKGHAALASALAQLLSSHDAEPRLPAGRSVFPAGDEWASSPDLAIEGDATLRCHAKRVREWLRASCVETLSEPEFQLLSGGRGDALVQSGGYEEASLITPVLEGDSVRARLLSGGQRSALELDWPVGKALKIVIGARQPEPNPHPDGSAPDQSGPASVVASERGDGGFDDARCVREVDAEHYAQCALGAGLRTCPATELSFGVLQRCVPRCAPDRSCKVGRCALWYGERGCIEP